MKKVFCWGTFDKLHEGHRKFLEDAKSKGDYLTVIVVSDEAVYENKGKFPEEKQKKRIGKIKKISIADEIICASDNCTSNFELITRLKPDIFVFGYDQDKKFIDKIKKYLKKKGVSTKYYISREFAGGIHTSKLETKKSIQELLEFGIINIDKPSGPTSFNISDFVRKTLKQYGIRKTSHFGTLDPKVTGVLPIALNRACKLTGFFIGHDKEYIGIMRIHKDVSLEKIRKAIKEKFIGKIKQTPPVKSRVKRQEREREIKKFEILEKNEKDILFHVEVEKGTYIRKLISDLGDYMKIGAHMLELRRTKAGIFEEKDSINLYDFEKAIDNENDLKKIIIPAEIVSKVYPVVEIKDKNLKQIFTGKPIYKEDLVKEEKFEKEQVICVFSNNKFVGMYKIANEKDILAKSMFVLQPI